MILSPTQRQTLNWSLLAAAAALLLWKLAPVLTPFAIAGVLAYALQPLVQALGRRGCPRVLAVALVEVAALLVALLLLLLLLPVLARELPQIRAQLPALLDRADAALAPLLGGLGLSLKIDFATLKGWLTQLLDDNGDWVGTLLSSARLGGSVLLSLLGNAVLVPVVLFYLLADWPRLTQRLLQLVPPRLSGAVGGFLGECDSLLGQYLRGQLLVMGLLALFYSMALALVGLDLALPVGLFTGLAVAVPYLGYGLGLVLALLSALLQFGPGSGVLLVVGVYAAGQVLESFVLTPRLVGERIGLSPLAVIFALLAFGQLFGFVGVLLALPASAVVAVALRRLEARYRRSRLFLGA